MRKHKGGKPCGQSEVNGRKRGTGKINGDIVRRVKALKALGHLAQIIC